MTQTCQIGADSGGHIVFKDIGDVELLLCGARADQIKCRLDAVTQIEGVVFNVHLPGFDFGKVEDFVDDAQKCVTAVVDGICVVALLVTEFGIHQQAAHPDDGIHRRANFVAHGGKERTLGLVGGFRSGAGVLCLLEQAHIFNRDHGLIAERLCDINLFFAERLLFLSRESQHAQTILSAHERQKNG